MLDFCTKQLSRWKSNNSLNSQDHINELKYLLHKAHEATHVDYQYIGSIKSERNQAYKLEEEFWRIRCKSLWLQAGDRNTKFSHEKTKLRRSQNRITALIDSTGRLTSHPKDI